MLCNYSSARLLSMFLWATLVWITPGATTQHRTADLAASAGAPTPEVMSQRASTGWYNTPEADHKALMPVPVFHDATQNG